jgi:signal transduction histidine kinase/ActR/RegA family two-component response regulator
MAVVAAGLALIVLTWVGTYDAMLAERAEATAHVQAELANEALVFETQLSGQLRIVDQTLGALERDWERDPDSFRLGGWGEQALIFADLAQYIYVADVHGIIRLSTRPDLIGGDISQRNYFRDRAALAADDGRTLIGPAVHGKMSKLWHVNMVRRLDTPDGKFAGIITAAYDPSFLTGLYNATGLGSHGVIALVGTQFGRIYGLAGPGADAPGGSVAGSPMLAAMQANPDGGWTGPSATDGVMRIHAFRHVVGRNMQIVVGIDRAEAMRASSSWQIGARIFAGVITLAVLVMMWALLRELNAARQREDRLNEERAKLENANAELLAAKTLADATSAQLQVTLAGMSDGVSMIDREMRLMQWNPKFPDFTGVPEDILRVGLPMEEVLRAQAEVGEFGDVDVEAEVERRLELLRTGQQPLVAERSRPDGRVLELRRSALPDGGFVTLYSDITARKQAEAALKAARELTEAAMTDKSRFVAIVSHEIRTPLNALLNGLTLLGDSALSPSQRGLLETARQSGDALLGLISDILEMSRAEAGHLTLRPNEFELRPLLEGVLDMFRAQAWEHGLVLRMHIAPDVPDTLYTDPGRLRQVLMNLFSNAAKFAHLGEVRLEVSTKLIGWRRVLRLGLSDEGPAIPPADRARLFQPFSRLERGADNTAPGTGLGLAICQRLTTLMGGEIGCDETPEGGNEFWLVLPIERAPEGREHGTAPATQRRPSPRIRQLPRTRILLVEDIVTNQLVTATMLRRRGHMVDIAANGTAAIQAAARAPYDLILMDIFMPGINGIEATRNIRAISAVAATVPILALTANTGSGERADCLAAGMNDMLSKPVELPALIEALARYAWVGWPSRDLWHEAPRAPRQEIVPALSEERLEDLRANLNPQQLSALIEQCLEELNARMPELRRALDEGRNDEIEAAAHAMAGMAGGYALGALEVQLRAVLRAVRNGSTRGAQAMATGMEAELARGAIALRDALGRAAA